MSPANRRSKPFVPGALGSYGDNFDASELKKSTLKEGHYEVLLVGTKVGRTLADRHLDQLAVGTQKTEHRPQGHCKRLRETSRMRDT
ncbi:MAG TPA: hypothetical protein VKH81_01575 [Candidatus Angelobacter sp.]|nr:hypothetical protein [Candidatus Angelobacter sp.]